MGTRVDFYVGRGENAEWLGSYPYDGYPSGVFTDAPPALFNPTSPPTEQHWRDWVAEFLDNEKGTTPDMGWPWPWKDSATTDYAYAWDSGRIYGSSFGHPWFEIDAAAEDWGESVGDAGDAAFPDMSERANMTLGPRSGIIVLGLE